MKSFRLYLAGFCLSVFCLTSCMKGSNEWEGIVFGVLDFSVKGGAFVLKTSSGDLYSPSLKSFMDEGSMKLYDCYIILCRLNSDLPENAPNVVAANGFQTISILQYEAIPKYGLSTSMLSTSTPLPNEVPVSKVIESSDFVDRYLFMVHVVSIPEDWELSWSLSYDFTSMMPTKDENGKRYYDLYVRATIKNESTKTQKVDMLFVNVYDIGSYFSTAATLEKISQESNYNENTSSFTVRFFYASSIDEETNTITWKNEQRDLKIADFLL